MTIGKIRLGVNIDHIATLRNARGGSHPDPIKAAKIVESVNADGITAHLREDRRHIKDKDIYNIKKQIKLPLNMEIAPTNEMKAIAIDVKPNACCIVPEKREEITTEGGLNVLSNEEYLKSFISELKEAGILVSIFIDPDIEQIKACARINADIIEIHTGQYCNSSGKEQQNELLKIQRAAKETVLNGLECHAGHGLCYDTVKPIAAISEIVELNIGHFLIGESVFSGLAESIKKMQALIKEARK